MSEKDENFNENDENDNKDKMDKSTVKVLSAIGYFGILFLIPLLACPNNKFARFHTNQAIILCITDAILGVVSTILAFIPFVGWIFSTVIGVLIFIIIVLQIVAVVNDEEKEIPIIGKFRILK